jgi:hypothetical protein
MVQNAFRLGVDVGGANTDAVIHDVKPSCPKTVAYYARCHDRIVNALRTGWQRPDFLLLPAMPCSRPLHECNRDQTRTQSGGRG